MQSIPVRPRPSTAIVDAVGVGVGVGVGLGVAEDSVGSGAGSWFATNAQIVPPSTSSSRTIRAMSGQVQGLRFFFCGLGVDGPSTARAAAAVAVAGGCARGQQLGHVVAGAAPVAIAGTAAAAAATSPRRSAVAARATAAAEAGRSSGFFAIIAMTRFCTGSATVGGSGGGVLVDLRHRDRDLRLARERALAGQALVRDDAERVDVGGGGCRVPGRLLGGEVLHRAHDLAGRGERHLVGDARDAEVGDLHPAVGSDQQVARA